MTSYSVAALFVCCGAALVLSWMRRRAVSKERERAEASLAYERNLLRTLIDNMPDCIYVKDSESRFLVANAGVAHLMGVGGPEQLLGKTDFDFYPRELAQRYRDDELTILRDGQAQTLMVRITERKEQEEQASRGGQVPESDELGVRAMAVRVAAFGV